MEVEFHYIPEFERRAKKLAKKYKSFIENVSDVYIKSLVKEAKK